MIKQILKITGALSLVMAMFAATTAFTGNNDDVLSDNSCTVTVKYSNGTLAKSVKVSTDVSGGISCSGGRDFYTNSDGQVQLKWAQGCNLKKVYVKGDGYTVNYKNGNSYTLRLN